MNQELTTTATTNPPAADLSIYNQNTFSQLVSISRLMAYSSLIPSSLKGKSDQETEANCFLVSEQAMRWGFSPFAVAQCASVVHGRLMWEGKLVAGVIEASLGIRLAYEYSGSGEKRAVIVSGTFPNETAPRIIEGDVAGWKTSGSGTPWVPNRYDQMLAYRGAREWARRHAPSVMLGIVTEDESEDVATMRNVTPPEPQEPIAPFPTQKSPAIEDKPVKAASKPATEKAATQSEYRHVFVQRVEESQGVKKDGSPYTLFRAHLTDDRGDFTAATFSSRIGAELTVLEGNYADLELRQTARGFEILSANPIAQETESDDLI